MKKTYKIEIDCANCANKLESTLKKIDGVVDANINFMFQKLTIEFVDTKDVKELEKEIKKTGNKIDSDFALLK